MPNPETKLTQKMMAVLRDRGAYVVKIHGSAYQTAGIPDLLICYKGHFIGIEVKVPGRESTVTDLQANTSRKIKAAGGIAVMFSYVEQVERMLDLIDKKRAAQLPT